jgi:hypothetical protein
LGETCGTYGGREKCRPLGRPRRRWEASINIDLKGIGGWINLAQDKDKRRNVLNTIMNLLGDFRIGQVIRTVKYSYDLVLLVK